MARPLLTLATPSTRASRFDTASRLWSFVALSFGEKELRIFKELLANGIFNYILFPRSSQTHAWAKCYFRFVRHRRNSVFKAWLRLMFQMPDALLSWLRGIAERVQPFTNQGVSFELLSFRNKWWAVCFCCFSVSKALPYPRSWFWRNLKNSETTLPQQIKTSSFTYFELASL